MAAVGAPFTLFVLCKELRTATEGTVREDIENMHFLSYLGVQKNAFLGVEE